MPRLTLRELERRCQKPDHQRIGNWMARHVARPAALSITWVIAPWGVSAHAVTLLAWLVAAAAAAQWAMGTPATWACAAVSLQLWYLLDHVDGQLARLRGTASLDGVQLDYLMHHTVNLLVPLGVGYGVARVRASDAWLALGLAWGIASLLSGLLHDARYKAFIQRLKRLHGELLVRGGGGARPEAQPARPTRPRAMIGWALQKACEPHVVMNGLTLVALAGLIAGDTRLLGGAVYVAAMAGFATLVAAARLASSLRRNAAESEFKDWFQTVPGTTLVFSDGWWHVERDG